MYNTGCFIRTKIICLLIFFLTIFFFPSASEAKTPDKEGKINHKALVLILDQIQTEDIIEAKTPNMDLLMENGGFGLMNVRSQAVINSNRASSFLSLGMGVRATAPKRNEWKVNNFSQGRWILEDVNGIKHNISNSERKRFGLIGQVLKEHGFKTGLIGDADNNGKSHMESALLIMDREGRVPLEYVGSFPSDEEIKNLFAQLDLLVIDFGDTVRVQQGRKQNSEADLIRAVERADRLLGEMIAEFGLKNNLYMVITPNPSPQALRNGNPSLTPVIVSNPLESHKGGILTSSSTRRDGLVINLDFAPTLLNFFGVEDFDKTIGVVPVKKNPQQIVARNEGLFLNLHKTRYLLHGTYILLILYALLYFFTKRLIKRGKKKWIDSLALIIINIPLASFITPLIMDYGQILIGYILIITITVAMIITWISNRLIKNFILSLGVSGLLTSMLIAGDSLSGANYLVNTPFGFNDVIVGGRFYGVNNDLMGIMLGSALLGIFSLAQNYQISRTKLVIFTSLMMILIILALSALYGANVGGTIGAIVIMLIALLVNLNYTITFKRAILIVSAGLLIEIGFVALDVALNKNLTHAGLFFQTVLNHGFMAFIDMILVKLGEVGLMLVLPPWNLVLFFQIHIIWKNFYRNKDYLREFKSKFALLYKGAVVTVLGAAVIFAFNDTGVIASAIMLTYMLIPLGYLTSRGENINASTMENSF